MSDDSLAAQIALSGVVIVLAIPGLVIEPGPLSEIVALGSLGVIWGFDLPGANNE